LLQDIQKKRKGKEASALKTFYGQGTLCQPYSL